MGFPRMSGSLGRIPCYLRSNRTAERWDPHGKSYMEAVLAKHSCGHSVVLDKFILQEVGWENIVLRASTFSCLNMEITRIDYVCIVYNLVPLASKEQAQEQEQE